MVKPRYDGKGSLFGMIHRNLPNYCYMIDLDLCLIQSFDGILCTVSNDNEGTFIEYRILQDGKHVIRAIFEYKYNFIDLNAIKNSTEFKALSILSENNGSRLFYVFAYFGKYPINIYEYIFDKDCFENVGIIKNEDEILVLWKKLGLLTIPDIKHIIS